jgi:hypothetical protein
MTCTVARKPNYDFEKRRKEQDRNARKEAKRNERKQRRDERQPEGESTDVPPPADGAPSDGGEVQGL